MVDYLLSILCGFRDIENNELKLILGPVSKEDHFQGTNASADVHDRGRQSGPVEIYRQQSSVGKDRRRNHAYQKQYFRWLYGVAVAWHFPSSFPSRTLVPTSQTRIP